MRKRWRNRKGRSEDQYFAITFPMAKSAAFRSLSGAALKVLIEVRTRFNGGNNGDLSLSLDEAARLLGIGKGTAQRALAELEDKGFLRRTRRGQWIGRQAATWRTTDKGSKGELPTNDWKAWQPRKPLPDVRHESEPSPEPGKSSPPRFGRHAA